MDDITAKLSELLSDEESVKQLSELAQMMMSDESTNDKVEAGNDVDITDFSGIIKLGSLLGSAAQSDKNTEFLLALKPHLNEEKQKKVDKAIKLLKLIAVWNMAKESGLLNDII
ncbi:MAG TPA: hypothetical protein P5191_11135 [Ruminococcus sp.]|nr:hypothetical protein [Ruminococcus sp.]